MNPHNLQNIVLLFRRGEKQHSKLSEFRDLIFFSLQIFSHTDEVTEKDSKRQKHPAVETNKHL